MCLKTYINKFIFWKVLLKIEKIVKFFFKFSINFFFKISLLLDALIAYINKIHIYIYIYTVHYKVALGFIYWGIISRWLGGYCMVMMMIIPNTCKFTWTLLYKKWGQYIEAQVVRCAQVKRAPKFSCTKQSWAG